jgi:beta-glucosidase
VPALVEGWLLGQAGGGALADVLFGVVNPSGRLAETIPLRLADHPSYLDFPGEQGHVRHGEGIHVGYRGFDAREQDVAYPFGFGLSYTTFEYSGLSVSTVDGGLEVRLTVTNTGTRDGREVVQVYTALAASRVRRAPRELKAFASVPIAAGASAAVVLPVELADLAYWDVELGRWVVEAGEYTVAVGASSRDIRATVTVAVDGDDERRPLSAGSTIAEWFADPRGAQALGEAFAAVAATGGGAAAQAVADPAMFALIANMPLDRVVGFAGDGFTPELLADLLKAAN